MGIANESRRRDGWELTCAQPGRKSWVGALSPAGSEATMGGLLLWKPVLLSHNVSQPPNVSDKAINR